MPVAAFEPALALFGCMFIAAGVVATVITLKWPGWRGGRFPLRFYVPDLRPSLALAFGALFWLAGVGMLLLSVSDPVVLPPK